MQALAHAAAYWDERLGRLSSSGEDLEDESDWIVPGEGEPWTSRNSSQLTPLINKEVMWLLKEAEDRLSNASGVPFALRTARRLAHFNSVAYCEHENIRLWNCTR